MVFQWRAGANLSHRETEDRALVRERMAVLWQVQQPAGRRRTDPVAPDLAGYLSWGINMLWGLTLWVNRAVSAITPTTALRSSTTIARSGCSTKPRSR